MPGWASHAPTGGYGRFDVATYFLHDVDAEIEAEGEPYQRSEADAFESVCDFKAWPSIRSSVLAGDDDRFFPVGLQRRIARARLGVEADVLPGGHLLPLVHPHLVVDYLLRPTGPHFTAMSASYHRRRASLTLKRKHAVGGVRTARRQATT